MTISIDIADKSFWKDKQTIRVLEDLRLNIIPGEFVTVIGPSGCGKSTLLKIIGGLDTAYDGQILIGDRRVTEPGMKQGFIFQEHRLFPWLSVEENIAANFNLKQQDVRRKVDELIEIVRLKGFEHAYPHELSGGMSQRVAIARAHSFVIRRSYCLMNHLVRWMHSHENTCRMCCWTFGRRRKQR